MAIQPDIALQVKPMQINDPLETAGKVLSIRGAQQNQALGAQQLQAGALHLQQQQMEMADQQTLRQALIANKGDREAALQSVVGKINPATYAAGLKSILDQKKELGELDKQKREALDFQLGKVSDALAPVLQAPPEQKAAVYQQGIGFLKAHGVDTSQMNPEYTNDEDIQASLAHANGYLKMSEEVRKQAEEKRAAAESAAKLPGVKADSDIKVAEAKGLNMSPVDAKQRVDAVIDPVKYPEQNRRALAMYTNALTLKDKNDALEKVSAEVGGMQAKTNPGVLQSEIDQKVKEQKALIPGEVSKALSIETATNPLKLQQARATAGATAGTREALKLDQDYVKIASATNEMGKVLDLADSGNKAAGSALATVGAISMNAVNGLKRLNRNEIEGIGGSGAGNAYDRVVGFFDKATAGQPIPQNIRDDIRSLHQAIGENAYKTYTTGLDALSKRSGTAYAPTVAPPNIAAKVFPADQVHAYAVAHGIDDVAAKKAIANSGYTVK